MSVMSLDALQDLFLLFANVGRKDKVVLGLTDTMYKKRLSTARNIDSLGKIGFRAMMEESPGLIDGLTVNVDYVFMQNLGYTDPKNPKYELTFDQFLDALAAVSVAKYPTLDPESAVKEVLAVHIRPLFIAKFGEEPPVGNADGSVEGDGGDGGDGGTVVTSRTQGTTTKTRSHRKSRVVLTADGIAAASAHVGGPKVAVVVDQTVETALLSGATVVNPGANGGNSVIGGSNAQPAIVKRTLNMKLGGGSALGVAHADGSVVEGGSGQANYGSRRQSSASRSPAGHNNAVSSSSPAAPARNAVPSIYSVNPFSPEARGTSPENFGAGAASKMSPAPAAARSPATGVAQSPEQQSNAELKSMVKNLLAVVEQLRAESSKLKAENMQLKAQVDILKATSSSPYGH